MEAYDSTPKTKWNANKFLKTKGAYRAQFNGRIHTYIVTFGLSDVTEAERQLSVIEVDQLIASATPTLT